MSSNQVSGQEKKEGQVERDPVVGFRKKGDGTIMCDCERILANPLSTAK